MKTRESRATRTRSHSTSSEDELAQPSHIGQSSPAGRGMKRRKAVPARGRALKRNTSPASENDDGEDSEDSGGDAGGESADDSESDDEEGAVMAPSGPAQRKHNRQTGLSISFANSFINVPTGGKKRARSPAQEENEQEVRAMKLSKVANRAAVSLDTDDDDDEIYNAVDLISESEDEVDLENLEEHAIMISEEELFPTGEQHLRSALRSSVSLNEGSLDFDQTPHFDEHFARTNGMEGIPDFMIPDFDETPTRKLKLPGERRVRFVDNLIRSDSEGARGLETDDNGQQSESDPNHPLHAFGSEPITEVEWRVYPPSDDASDLDEGHTTDEDVLLPTTVNRPNEKLHDIPIPSSANTRRRNSFSAYRPLPQVIGYQGPSMGSWVADPTKPIAVTDRSGTKLVYFPPQNLNELVAQTSRQRSGTLTPKVERLIACLNQGGDDDAETSSDDEEGANRFFQDTVLGPVADQMFSDFHNCSRSLIRRPRASSDGVARASGVVQSIDTNDWDESDGDDDDDAGEKHLRIEDLIHVGGTSSESGGEEVAEGPGSTATPTTSQESAQKRISSSSPERVIDDTPEWPALHRPSPRGAAGAKRDRHSSRATSSSGSPAKSAKLATKLASKSVASPTKRLKTRH